MKKRINQFVMEVASAIRSNSNRILPAAVMLVFFSFHALAATDPFAEATGTITGYAESVKKLLYAIAAIIALVGAFNVYHKMTNGDQDVKKTIMLTLGGCIAMLALSEALPAFFGTTTAGS